MYTVFFISFVVSSTCFGCYLHRPSEAPLPRTAVGFVWFGVLFHWSRYWFSLKLTVLKCKGDPNQYLLQWNNTPKPYTTYGCARQLCSWWWVQIAPETRRANDERNEEYSVHLVGPELNIYIISSSSFVWFYSLVRTLPTQTMLASMWGALAVTFFKGSGCQMHSKTPSSRTRDSSVKVTVP
jgi:hypothetical protein